MQPRQMQMMGRALRGRCPVCADGSISRHPAHVDRVCSVCGLDLERQVGSFIGGVGLNTIVTFGALLITIVIAFIVVGLDGNVVKVLIPAVAVAIVVPLVFYARSKLLWVAFELRFWPLEPGETRLIKR